MKGYEARTWFLAIAVFGAFLLATAVAAPATVVGTASLPVPAVILSNNTGSLTNFTLVVTQGTGNVMIVGPSIVGSSTLQSAQAAAQYAAKYLNLKFGNYNFTYNITGGTENVSGPSGGAAMTILAISALSGKQLLDNFTMTGTISQNGTIGPIGGVYDKSSAAKAGGLSFIMVPKFDNQSVYDELYLLVQSTFNIPLIQVANISQAYKFAFTKANITANATTYPFYTKINLYNLQPAPIACSNSCNESLFNQVAQGTFSLVNASINNMSLNPNFVGEASQLHAALAQSEAVAGKGYIYGGANLAFLNYADSYMFNSYVFNESDGYAALSGISDSCGMLQPQQLTTTNYEYVIGGQLRQAWGTYTVASDLSQYNSSVETTDDVLLFMRSAANSNGWCYAASQMFNASGTTGGTDVLPNGNLSDIAAARLGRATEYGSSMYLNTAKLAYKAHNYPLAIIDADYAYAIPNATETGASLGTGALINASAALAQNSTFGVWATQFANEAELYIYESRASSNATTALAYAQSAYSAALLASQMSMDMKLISQNLSPGVGTISISNVTVSQNQTTNPTGSQSNSQLTRSINSLSSSLQNLYAIVVIMLAIIVSLTIVVLYLLTKIQFYTSSLHRQSKGTAGKPQQRPRR